MKALVLAFVAGAGLAGCAVYPAGYPAYGNAYPGYGAAYPAYGYPAYGSVNVYGTYGGTYGGHRYWRDRDGAYRYYGR